MVKCVVSSCQNRKELEEDRGFSRAPKRFFSFPQDPARVKVWLAALREPDKQDWTENHVICEDHFLPEDISPSGVSPDAIPIMPPCLEDELGIDAWPEDPEEDDGWAMGDEEQPDNDEEEEVYDEEEEVNYEEEEVKDKAKEEETAEVEEKRGEEEEDEAMDVNGDEEQDDTPTPEAVPTATEGSTAAADRATAPPADIEASQSNSPAPDLPPPPTSLSSWEPTKSNREDMSLHLLTRRFLELLLNREGLLDVRDAAKALQSPKRRVYDVTNILMGVDLLRKEAVNKVRWTGKCPISSFLWEKQKMQQESDKLKQVEDTLDGLIKTCAQQLFSMTDDRDNANSAFVTYTDVENLAVFQDQTVMVVKAPEETKLEVPAPKEDCIQVHLKSGSGPISVLTFNRWPDSSGKTPQTFKRIQHSHIKTRELQTESSSQSSVLSL